MADGIVLDSNPCSAREWGLKMNVAQVSKAALLISAAVLFAGSTALSQDSARKRPSQPPAKPQASAPHDSKKTSLDDPGRARSSGKASPDDAVVEFHPAPPGSDKARDPALSPTKPSKKPALDKVHGTLYGATGMPGGAAKSDRIGGNVGVTNKSGKTSVVVQTERSRDSTSPPR